MSLTKSLSLREAQERLRRLAREVGVGPHLLARFGVRPTDTAEQAHDLHDDGVCQVEGCDCSETTAAYEAPETPEEAAIVGRIMRRTQSNVTRGQVLAVYRAQFAEPKAAPRKRRRAKRKGSKMMTLAQARRQPAVIAAAARSGGDIDKYACAYMVQFPQGNS